MPLNHCKECKKAVSNLATTCPHCGAANPPLVTTKAQARIAAFAVIGFVSVVTLSICSREPAAKDASQSKRASVGEKTKISRKGFQGCIDREAQDKLTSFAVQRDQSAFDRYLGSLYASGACAHLRLGEEVYLVDITLGGMAKIRRPGETQEYWTNVEAIEREDVAH